MELSHTEIAPISSARLAPPRRTAEAPGATFPASSHVLTGLQLLWPVYAHRTWSQMGLGSGTAPSPGCPRASHWAFLRLGLSVCTVGLPHPPHRSIVRMA